VEGERGHVRRSLLEAEPPALIRARFVLPAVILATPALARADDPELDMSWRIETDLRFRVESKAIGGTYDRIELPAGVERNQNTLGFKLDAAFGRFKGVAAIDFVLNGYSAELEGIGALSRIEDVSRYRFDVPALYIEAKDLFVDGLDLRIGQQLVLWGEGDQFNPTNNLNADDLRDPLLFGKQQGNFMVKADYWVTDNFTISGVMVPIFRPALLPESAALGAGAVDRLPFTDAAIRHRLESEFAASAGNLIDHPTVVATLTPELPEAAFDNIQAAFRLAGTIGEQDIALSYYNGRTDFPVARANHTRQSVGERCDPDVPGECVKGLLETDVTLHYPRMHVYGLNAAGEFNPFSWISEDINGIGYRFEGALIVPQRSTVKITQDALALVVPQPAGEYDYDKDGIPGGDEPAAVESTPFLKWVVGLDYTFGEHLYTNAQWVHGIVDEYGAGDFISDGWAVRQSGVTTSEADTLGCVLAKDGTMCAREVLRPRIADYIVLGVDIKFLSDAALLRLFTIWDVTGIVEEQWDPARGERVQTSHPFYTKEGFSAVIYPELSYNFGNGLELSAGALVQLGKDYTKFGDPAAGGSTVFTRARFSM
jgi:hypothetical protein